MSAIDVTRCPRCQRELVVEEDTPVYAPCARCHRELTHLAPDTLDDDADWHLEPDELAF